MLFMVIIKKQDIEYNTFDSTGCKKGRKNAKGYHVHDVCRFFIFGSALPVAGNQRVYCQTNCR